MQVKVVNLIDDRGFYLEPQYVYTAENLEEAKQLNYPITKRTVRNESPANFEETPELKALRSRLAGLNAIPEKDAAIVDWISNTEIEIQAILEDLEARRQADEWIDVEEYVVPPLNAYQIETEVPEGFWHPKWDGFRWIEGLTPAEIEARVPKGVDWDGFVNDWLASDLDDAIAQTSNVVWLTRLNIAIDKRPAIDVDWLITTWNKCIEGLSTPLTKAQIKTGRDFIKARNIPLVLNPDGAIAHLSS